VFVLGVDPGLSRCGYGCVEQRGRAQRAIAAGVIATPPSASVPARLAELQREFRALLIELQPAVVVVERVLFQANVRTAMSVGQASGVIMAEAAARGCEVAEYSPNEVKEAVAGWGAASKQQVERMVQTLLGIDQPLRPVDAADAVALALCHLARAPRARVANTARAPRARVANTARAPRARVGRAR
jgi:crossover junction endodeoxyribonuclease RuvC